MGTSIGIDLCNHHLSHVELELQHFKAPGSSLQTFHLAPDEAYMYMDIKIQQSHHKAGKQQTWGAGRAQW